MPDTIAAIATAPAAAAVGIVRLSGAETRRVLAALFTPVDGRSAAELPTRRSSGPRSIRAARASVPPPRRR